MTDTSERSVYLAYQLDSNDVLKDLGTSEQGLSSAEGLNSIKTKL